MQSDPSPRKTFTFDAKGGLLAGMVLVGFCLLPVGLGMLTEARGIATFAMVSVVVMVLGVVVLVVRALLLRRHWRSLRESPR